MKEIPWASAAQETLEALKTGAFLTTAANGKVNTMTIGWGSVGVIWQKPVFTVLVRKSRFTYQLIEESREFTVTVPGVMMARAALQLCGTKSGRDMDKLAAANLKAAPAIHLATPRLDCTGIHYECKVLDQYAMNSAHLDNTVQQHCYVDNDYHTIYFGEILACYRQE